MNVFQESIKSLIPIDITHVRIDLKRPKKYSAEFCNYTVDNRLCVYSLTIFLIS